MSKKNKFLRSIVKNIVNQIIPVMIGVYLGFALNNYGEGRKLKKQKATFEKMLFNEVLANLESVTNSLPYHLTFQNDIDSLSNAVDPYIAFDNYVIRGLRLPQLNSGAYDTGVQTGLFSEFDLQFVQFINKLYTVQKATIQTNNSILSSAISREQPDNVQETIKLLASMETNLNDITAGEYRLQKFYCEILRNYFKSDSHLFEKYCSDVERY